MHGCLRPRTTGVVGDPFQHAGECYAVEMPVGKRQVAAVATCHQRDAVISIEFRETLLGEEQALPCQIQRNHLTSTWGAMFCVMLPSPQPKSRNRASGGSSRNSFHA